MWRRNLEHVNISKDFIGIIVIGPYAALTFTGALAAGMFALVLARHLRSPGIIFLLFTGVILGPDGLSWIEPETLGGLLPMIVGMAVAVILFEGGLHLEFNRIRNESAIINRLITFGALITALVGAYLAHLIMGWGWELSFLFGTLIIVTGPTVVTPLLRRIKVNKNLQNILEAEGVLIDPIGAIIAVVALDFVITSADTTVMQGFLHLSLKFGFGAIVGILSGSIIAWLLKQEKIVPDELENILTLGAVLFFFEASNALVHESGIMTVTIAGMVVGNSKIPMHRKLVDFKEQLTVMLIGVLFVLLSADVRLADIEALGTPAWLTVAGVMFIARPINIFLCTLNSSLTWREKLFLSWLAPRGIVAAAVASLFAADLNKAGIPGGEGLRALVFLIIATTVILQGFSANALAKALNLKRNAKDGYLIVGANALGRLMANLLKNDNEEIVFIDRNIYDCKKAKQNGFKVVYGNALEEHILEKTNPEIRRGIIGLTPNEGVNLMLVRRVHELAKDRELFITLKLGSAIDSQVIKSINGHALFGSQIDFEFWNHLIAQKLAHQEQWEYTADTPLIITPEFDIYAFGKEEDYMLPLTVSYPNASKSPVYDGMTIKKGGVMTILFQNALTDTGRDWLGSHGFKKIPTAN